MNGLLGNFLFLNPWLLLGLLALPALWFLLRVTPPAPKLIILPTAHFLEGLIPKQQTPSHTPWWILFLRMTITALVIVALARPVYNPADGLAGNGPVRIVIDNSWPSAQVWDDEMRAAQDIAAQAGREDRDIYILTTAPAPGKKEPSSFGPLSQGQADAIIKGLKPMAWGADYKAMRELISDHAIKNSKTFWISHGLDEGGIDVALRALQQSGDVTYLSPRPEQLPLLLAPEKPAGSSLKISVLAAETTPKGRPVTVQALTDDGTLLDQKAISLDPEQLPLSIEFDIPETIRGDVSTFRINGKVGAGGVLLLDESARKKLVGLVGPSDDEDTKPFVEARYYLTRALEPFATLVQGDINDILKQSPSVIILADIAALSPENLDALDAWVKKGGLLLRFAGPVMAQNQNENFLTPVPLRGGNRSMDGSLTWEKPTKIKSFPETSPLYGINLHEEITVRQQILADPVEDLDKKTWAQLEDGTPLITASPLEKGLLVMIHTTASPDWSDLALSGTFVEILKQIVSISGNPQAALSKMNGMMEPVRVLDGLGALLKPDNTVRGISAAEFDETVAGPEHPPGLYGREGSQKALNIGTHIIKLATPALPSGIESRVYGTDYEQDLMPDFLYAALILLLVDWLIMTILAAGWQMATRFACIGLFLLIPITARAETSQDIQYADGLYLAYVVTGNSVVDETSRRGLENLAGLLSHRTSIEPAGVAGLDPETDTLAFFPFIYWPVDTAQQPLTSKATQNIQHYLDHGGTILFDTRDKSYGAGNLIGTENANVLRMLTASLNIPPLEPAKKEHVLNRSFYLLAGHTAYDPGTIWVEGKVNGRDGVSSVIIGSHDWASAWAGIGGDTGYYGMPTRQQEMEFRFGVNLVMYALTGNYKADQVHIPHILERLGQ